MLRQGALAALALLVLPGCVTPALDAEAGLAPGAVAPSDALAFSPTLLIDKVRSGGEPVIQITPKGTILVATHPGVSHTRYPPSPNLLTPTSGQSFIWRSTDRGETWQPIGLPGANGAGPRGVGQGVGDPDFAMDANGRIYFTDLELLAAASVSWSDDDGATWLLGNNLASTYGPVDRQWLATHGTDVYLTGNYFVGQRVLKSSNGGITWAEVGRSNCGGDIASREDGVLLVGCAGEGSGGGAFEPAGIDVSTDDGKTWTRREIPGSSPHGRTMAEPAVDKAGNVYIVWSESTGIFVAGTRDLGETWTTPLRVSETIHPNGTHVWPWVVAGDEGRVAVVWYGTAAEGGPSKASGEWFVYQATVLDALSAEPNVWVAQVTPEPILDGGMCQRGTTCQLDPTPTGDRRLGDFFEAAVDAEGFVNLAFAVVGDEPMSHPGFARQTSGPSLFAPSAG